MKKLLLSALFSLPLWAQSATLNLSCASNVRAGSTLTCSIALAGGSLPAGLQWTLATSSPVGAVVITPAATVTAVQKNFLCNAVNMCLLTGINANQIADGALATLSIPIPAGSGARQMTLNLSATIGASLLGTAVSATANPPVSVSILSGCDINGDGQTNAADVTAEQNGVLAMPQTASDLNSDGNADVVDVQIVINAARGFACAAQ
jgi:Dockerin type I domain